MTVKTSIQITIYMEIAYLLVWCNEVGKKKLTISVRDEVDDRFREVVFKRKGMKKGNIGDAVEEAMLMWIGGNNNKKTESDK